MIKGKCLCGDTQVEVKALKSSVIVCHCSMCVKQAAGPLFYSDAVKEKDYHFSETSEVSTYESSHHAERGFCGKCGTFVFMRYKKNTNTHFNIELFEELDKSILSEIHLKDKKGYYSLS